MNKDVECPYCGEWQDICHDDGYGYDEYTVYNQECEYCDKTFVFRIIIFLDYEAKKAPCLNGGEHNWENIKGYPELFFEQKRRCSVCDEEVILDEKVHRENLKKYSESLSGAGK